MTTLNSDDLQVCAAIELNLAALDVRSSTTVDSVEWYARRCAGDDSANARRAAGMLNAKLRTDQTLRRSAAAWRNWYISALRP